MLDDEKIWEVRVWTWKSFWDATLDRASSRYQLLDRADLIMGSVHWTGDFMGASRPPHAEPLTLYRHWLAVCRLSSSVTVWPDPQEHLIAGAKGSLYASLNKVSRALGLDTISTMLVTPKATIQQVYSDIIEGRASVVLKREYSAGALHAFIPGQTEEDASERWRHAQELERLWDAIDEDEEGLHFNRPRWLVQPYIRELQGYGELRVHCVGGIVSHVIHSIPTDITLVSSDVNIATYFGNLDKISSKAREGITTIWDQSLMELGNETGEFQAYVLNTLAKLIIHEEHVYGVTSGLRLFARLDVGVYKDKRSGKFRYWVNEITRSHASSMFETTIANHGIFDVFWTTLTQCLQIATMHKLFQKKHLPHPKV
ncbi:hypothetical protein EST38_g12202 [Candolleomyces aberdarensis]|uniref:Uncharacterized protein n=1 Tax=Candolleomyces aberdarensis TaxID=2316362 RepID=A0A4Q2D591_9AGAR|nr:hypothetical protein EST38_g12202 [Candolleomyces aberdarensis]